MSNIQNFLSQILAAKYGKDVRQSIHDAIREVDSVADTAKNSATASATAASASAKSAKTSETAAKTSETAAKASETAAKTSETAAKASETAAKASETAAKTSETAAKASETAAKASETVAKASETAAKASETVAKASETNAKGSADAALQCETDAREHENFAKSYAIGTDGDVRPGDDTDNAAYYYEQSKRISQGLQGALMPMGTIAFTQLTSTSPQAGYMYNISDAFMTDSTFNEGAGHAYPAGTNVYWTAGGMWDCMAGTAVGGVKGAKESTYREGLVNLTPADIGALPEDGDSKDSHVSFTSRDAVSSTGWLNVSTLSSGETHASLFNKISIMFKNVRYLYKLLGTTDISAIGGGTVTGAIASQNTTFSNAIAALQTGKADTSHAHAWGSITGKPAVFTPAAHTHDERYYTEAEVNTLIANSKVVVANKAASKAISVPAGSTGEVSIDVTLSGRTPILAVVTNTVASFCYPYAVILVANTVTVRLRNTAASADASATVSIRVLYI